MFDAMTGMAMVRWWRKNGKWGQLARKDVEIHHEPETWSVEARQGGWEEKRRIYAAASQAEAEQLAERFMRTDERWREMSDGKCSRTRVESPRSSSRRGVCRHSP